MLMSDNISLSSSASVGSSLSSSLKKGKKVLTPFNTSPVAPSTYSHIRDQPTATFAINLGKSHEEWLKRNPDFALGGAESDDEADEQAREREKSQQQKGKKKLPNMNSSNDELQQWLDSDEGGGGGQLCLKPACVFVVKSLMMNEVLKKVEFDAIMAKMQTVNEDLQVSELEEEAADAKLAVINAQINEAEKHIASMEHKEELLHEKAKELKIERETFSEKQHALESVQRECARKLREKQAILAKIIWRKPGEKRLDDEDSFISISALTDSMLITKTPKNFSEPMPLSASYGKMAGGGTLDYNEKVQQIRQVLASSSSSVHSTHTSPARLGASPSVKGDRYIDGRLCLLPMKFASYTPTIAVTAPALNPSSLASSSSSSLLSSPGSRASTNTRSLTTAAASRTDPLPSPMSAKPWTAAQVSANYDFLLDKLLLSSSQKKRSNRSSSTEQHAVLSPGGYKGYTPTGSTTFRNEEMKKGHIRGSTAFNTIASASLEFEQGNDVSEDEEERTVGTGIQTLSTLSMRSFASSATSPSTSAAPAWEQLDPSFYNVRSCNLFGKNRKIGDVRVENSRRRVLTRSHPGMALGFGLERGKEEEVQGDDEEEGDRE